MDFDTSIDFPGQSILSGPAASVMGSVAFAENPAETIVLDIGGTTTDMAVLINSIPVLVPNGIEINGVKTLIRALHTRSVGLGGDSTVRIQSGELTIGPDRTGPAMAYGGSIPTPTDALFVIGRATNGNLENSERELKPLRMRWASPRRKPHTKFLTQHAALSWKKRVRWWKKSTANPYTPFGKHWKGTG
jgi:N-methylhydantoinase A